MNTVDVKSNTYINSSNEINGKDPKFKIGNILRISKYKNIFAKGYLQNWSEEVFLIEKVKSTVPWTHVTSDLNREEIVGTFFLKRIEKNETKRIYDRKINLKKRRETIC